MPTSDDQLILATAQDISGSANDVVVGEDVIYIPQVNDHTGTAKNDRPNVSGRLHLNVIATTDLLAAVDGCVVTINLYNDTDAVPTTGGTVILSQAITVNTPAVNYVAGTQIMSVPLPVTVLSPYLGLSIVLTVQDLTTGAISAWIGPPIQQGGEHGAL